jgi:AbrB family looped-hinge helix DNA binding protein
VGELASAEGKTYPAVMNAQTKLSAKGQVVIPKAVRDRLQWANGEELELVEAAGGVLLRRRPAPRERITIEEFHRRVPPHKGPPVSLEDMKKAVLDEAGHRYRRAVAPDDE